MEVRRPVLLVGLGSPALDIEGVEVRVVPLSRVRPEVDACREGCVVVLGAAALRWYRPEELAALPDSPRCVLLAHARGAEPETIAAWARAVPVRFVGTGELVRAVLEATLVLRRERMPLETWAPLEPGQGREFLGALETVQDLLVVTVKDWVSRLATSRSTLYRLCIRECGRSPERLLWDYLRAYSAAGLARGATWDCMACLVGYSSGYAFRRALARRWPEDNHGCQPHRPESECNQVGSRDTKWGLTPT